MPAYDHSDPRGMMNVGPANFCCIGCGKGLKTDGSETIPLKSQIAPEDKARRIDFDGKRQVVCDVCKFVNHLNFHCYIFGGKT